MPVQIGGQRESSFAEPFGMLKDCHRRVEMFLGVLVRVSERAGEQLTDEESDALAGSLRYFRDAAPKHTADEEESVFPRLRRLDGAEISEVLAQVEALEKDHRAAGPDHETVDRIGSQWLQSELSREERTEFDQAVRRLAAMYREHIQLEDSKLFPAAARLLGKRDREEIGAEMARRRGVSLQK